MPAFSIHSLQPEGDNSIPKSEKDPVSAETIDNAPEAKNPEATTNERPVGETDIDSKVEEITSIVGDKTDIPEDLDPIKEPKDRTTAEADPEEESFIIGVMGEHGSGE